MTADGAVAGDPAVREVRRSFLGRGAVSAGGAAATLVSTVLAVRTLDPAEAAVFLSVLAALMIGPMIGRLGLGYNIVRVLSAERDPARFRTSAGEHLLTTVLLGVAGAGIVAVIATLGLGDRPEHLTVIGLVVVLVVAETARLTYSDLFAARGAVAWSVATMHHTRSMAALLVLLGVVAFDTTPSLTGMLTAYAVVALALLVVAAWALRDHVDLATRLTRRTVRALVAAGVLLFTLDLSVYLVGRGDVWLASAVFDPVTATGYGTASTLAYQVTIFQGLASLAVTPVAARMWADGRREDAGRLLGAVATVTTAVAAVLVVAAGVLGGPLLGLLYGEPLRAAAPLLVLLAAGGVAQTAFGPNVTLLVISGHLRRAALVTTVTLVVVVTLAVPAAMYGGATGLATASGGAIVVLAGAQYAASRGILTRTPRPSLDLVGALRLLRDRPGAAS